MKKAGLMFSSLVVSLFAMNFVSAAVSIGDFFQEIGTENLVLGTLFLIFFAFINFILTKSFMKDNRPVAGVISFCVSLLAVYGIYYADFDITGLMFNFGVTEDIITTWVPIIFIAGLVFLSYSKKEKKWKFYRTFLISGVLFIILGMTEAVYESGLFIIIGIILLMLGFYLWWKKRKKGNLDELKKNVNSSNSKPVDRTSDLIKEAKYFRDWAIKTGKPGFYGSWSYFLSWLNKKGWGRNEREIITNFGISQNNFIKIFNKYGKP